MIGVSRFHLTASIAAVFAAGLASILVAHGAIAQPLDLGPCDYKGPAGHDGRGVILSVLSPEEAKRLIARSQAHVQSTINLDYLENRRVVVGTPNGRRVVALLPETMLAKPGDEVAFAGGHQTPGDPCSYIPNLVTRILPSPRAGTP